MTGTSQGKIFSRTSVGPRVRQTQVWGDQRELTGQFEQFDESGKWVSRRNWEITKIREVMIGGVSSFSSFFSQSTNMWQCLPSRPLANISNTKFCKIWVERLADVDKYWWGEGCLGWDSRAGREDLPDGGQWVHDLQRWGRVGDPGAVILFCYMEEGCVVFITMFCS